MSVIILLVMSAISQKAIARKVRKDFDNPLTQAMLDLRLEQLKLKAQSDENQRRIDALHDTLSVNAKHYGLHAQDFGSAGKRKLPEISNIPHTDTLGQRIKNSLKNLGKKLLSFVGLGNESNTTEKLKPFLATVDNALHEAKPGQTFTDYFYENPALEMIIDQPSKDERPKLFELVIDELLEEDTKLNLSSETALYSMRRLAALSSDFLYENKPFIVDDKNPNFKLLQSTIAKYLDVAFDDKNFKDQISRSIDTFKALVPKIIVAMMKHAKETSTSFKDLRVKLLDYANKLDNYFSDISQVVYKEPSSEADERISQFFAPDYDHTDFDLIVLNQVKDFINEAEKNISIDRDLTRFLSENKKMSKAVIDNYRPLVNRMQRNLVDQNIHGSLRLNDRTTADSDDDVVTGQGPDHFEKIFSDNASVIYALITFKPITTSQSRKLVDWIFDESNGLPSEKADLKSRTKDFIADPTNQELKDFFFANKQKIVYLYLMDSLLFNSKGKVTNVSNDELNLLMGAVRKAQAK